MTAIPLSQLATSRRWQSNFLAVLPAVQSHAMVCFRRLRPDARAEAMADTIARAFVDYGCLAKRNRLAHAYAGSLASFAVQRVRGHRQVGSRQNSKDVLNPLTHQKKGITVNSLSPWCGKEDTWRDLVLESRRVSPADQACFNVDFQEWLKRWPQRHRQIIGYLASGHRVKAVARKFGVTEGRVSQMRDQYRRSWEQFQGAATPQPVAA